ncbi:MAG: DUF547 domain-containing protein [Proteobacteria bacterium]|nr:DUF547 domain-containing protein [Pseudomonadota bacterium]
MKKIIVLLIILVSSSFTESKAQAIQPFFDGADTFFKTYIFDGKVDYQAITDAPELLNSLLEKAKKIEVSAADRAAYQAFWINAYNLLVIKGVINNYPIKSPLDKKGFFDKIKYDVANTSITLNDIENIKLRAVFEKEARFHFVLVCAGLGCPPIINRAYKPKSLETQLQKQTEIALNNSNFIKVKGDKVQISQIFEWYKGDFTKNGNEIDYINKFRKVPIPEKAKVSYYPYDWRLNSK